MRIAQPLFFISVLLFLMSHIAMAEAPQGEHAAALAGTEILLGGAISDVRTGGAGRYLIFRLKDADKLVVVDAVAGKLLKPIAAPGDFQFAADRESLFVVLNGQRVVQKWDLKTQTRLKTVLLSDDRPVQLAVMGNAGAGPLALWAGGKVAFIDADTLKTLTVSGNPIDVAGGVNLWPSADGLTFAGFGWTTGAVQLMRLSEVTATTAACQTTPSAAGVSYNMAWAFPGPDGSMIVGNDGSASLFAQGTKPLDATQFKGAVLYPTQDARFLLALRRSDPYSAKGNLISIVAASDRQVLYTLHNMEPVTGGQIGTTIGRIANEPRVRYLPAEKLLICVPDSDDRVDIHPFDLDHSLQETGADYLFVISLPSARAMVGQPFAYQVEAISKAGDVKYKLDDAPPGMAISDSGKITWDVPQEPGKEKVPVIVTVTDKSGAEATHAFELSFPPPPVKPIAAVPAQDHQPAATQDPDQPAVLVNVAQAKPLREARARLVGSWDADAVLDEHKVEAMLKVAPPALQTPDGRARLRKSLAPVKLQMTLHEDGTGDTTLSGLGDTPRPLPFRWEIRAGSANSAGVPVKLQLTLKLTDVDRGVHESELLFWKMERLTLTLPGDRVDPLQNTLTFHRAAPALPGAPATDSKTP